MEWFTFVKCYFGILILYYAIIITYDYLVGLRNRRLPEEDEISYAVSELVNEKGNSIYIAKEKQSEPTDAGSIAESSPPVLEPPPSDEPAEYQPIVFSQPPQGQGIPLEKFLEIAKGHMKEIQFH